MSIAGYAVAVVVGMMIGSLGMLAVVALCMAAAAGDKQVKPKQEREG